MQDNINDKELVLQAMREASTLEALEAIPVDYDSVPLPGGETA